MVEKEISIIGISYLKPIIELYSTLDRTNFTRSSEIRVSMNENGYSCSIIVLCVFCIESFITRIRYLKQDNLIKKTKALDCFIEQFGIQPLPNDLKDKLTEVFVLRDIIAHNHLWEINYSLNENFDEISIIKNKFGGWGDKKFDSSTDLNKEKTNKLKLNILPTKIGKDDAKEVLLVLKEFLDFISDQNKSYCNKALYSELNKLLKNAKNHN